MTFAEYVRDLAIRVAEADRAWAEEFAEAIIEGPESSRWVRVDELANSANELTQELHALSVASVRNEAIAKYGS